MNGWELMSTKLEAGEQVCFQFESRRQSGSLLMELLAPDGTAIHCFGDEASETHTLTAHAPGRYSARVTADHAAGGFRLEVLAS
jgi:hypothetical protein